MKRFWGDGKMKSGFENDHFKITSIFLEMIYIYIFNDEIIYKYNDVYFDEMINIYLTL